MLTLWGHSDISPLFTNLKGELMKARSAGIKASVSLVLAVFVIFSMLFSATGTVFAQGEQPPDGAPAEAAEEATFEPAEPEALVQEVQAKGSASVIVTLKVNLPAPDSSAESAAPRMISMAQSRLMAALATRGVKAEQVQRYKNFPLLTMRVDEAGLRALLANPQVEAVDLNTRNELLLNDSTAIIGAQTAWNLGFTGDGVTVAIMDTGVLKTHPFFGGRVVAEGCFSGADGYWDDEGETYSLCPGGAWQSTALNSALPCDGFDGCDHGTHVAGIAAGNGPDFGGVAPDANIIALKVFTEYRYNGGGSDIFAWDSDMIAGLDYLYSLRNNYNISSVNLSIGGGGYAGYCDSKRVAFKKAIDRLRSANIATVIASGNEYYTKYISAPACISSAVSVGSTTKDDTMSDFGNSASILQLLAPGSDIYSSVVEGSGYDYKSGTSMAAPHVAGAWGVMRQAHPELNVTQVLSLFKSTGVPIKDHRVNRTKPRINIDYALGKYVKPEALPNLVSPVGGPTLTDSTPEFIWNPVPYANKYTVTAKRGTATVFTKTVNAGQVCNYIDSECYLHDSKILPVGSFTWTVKPTSAKGAGLPSTPGSFNTPNTLPSTVILGGPEAESTITYFNPVFWWRADGLPRADKYKFELFKNGRKSFSATYLEMKICDGNECSVQLTSKLVPAHYTWRVTPQNGVGSAAYSQQDFEVEFNGFNTPFNNTGDLDGWTILYPSPYGEDWWFDSGTLATWYGWNYTWASLNYNAYYKNFDYTVTFRREGDSDLANSIVIKGNPALNGIMNWKGGYSFQVTNSGWYSVYKLSGNTATAKVPWDCCVPDINTGDGEFNTVRVRVSEGGNVQFLVNGYSIVTGNNITDLKSPGIVGFKSYVMEWSGDYLYLDQAVNNADTGLAAGEQAGEIEGGPRILDDDVSYPNTPGSLAGPFISEGEYLSRTDQAPSGLTFAQKLMQCAVSGREVCPAEEQFLK